MEHLSPELGACMDVLRCGAHTVNLAIKDAIKQTKCEEQLAQIRTHVKKSKSVVFRPIYKMHGIPVPSLDCDTRWCSTYNMVESFLKIEGVVNELRKVDPAYEVDSSLWSFCEQFEQAFKPTKNLLKKLQREQLTLGDMYRYYWIDARNELQKLSDNELAVALLEGLKERKRQLFQNKTFLAGLFMDPRFNFKDSPYLSTEQKQLAIVSLSIISFQCLYVSVVYICVYWDQF